MSTRNTKVLGLRLPIEKLNDFEIACKNLPISFKPTELLRGYIDYIIQSSEQYKETGHIKMGFLTYNSSIIILNLEGKQTEIQIEEVEKDEQKQL